MSKAEFEQEYLASFTTYEGQIWGYSDDFDTPASSFLGCDYDCIFGADWGLRDPSAFVSILWNGDYFIVVDEYLKNAKTTAMHASAMQKLIDKWNPLVIYTDSAAAQTKFDLAMDYNITMTNAKKAKLEGIGYVAGLFESGKIKICPSCTNTLAAVDQYQWDSRAILKQTPLHNSASHIADALRYALYTYNTSSCGVFG